MQQEFFHLKFGKRSLFLSAFSGCGTSAGNEIEIEDLN